MTRDEARELYMSMRSQGYSDAEARSALRARKSPDDPTQQYWDSVVTQESGGRQDAISPAGAVGIAQVMPATGPEAAELAGRPWDEVAFREDPEYNAALGRAYLRKQMQRFNDPALGLAAYNAGPGRVQQYLDEGRPLPAETQAYVPAVQGRTEGSMTREQARQYAQNRMAEGADLATVREELRMLRGGAAAPQQAPQQQAPALPQQQAPAPTPAPMVQGTPPVAPSAQQAPQQQGAQLPSNLMFGGKDLDEHLQGYLEESYPSMSGNFADKAMHGFSRGVAGTIRGARQLWNDIGSDDEDRRMSEYLRGREGVARDFEEKINPAGSGLQLQDIAKMSPAVMAGSAIRGPGIVAGAAQGAITPLDEGESRLFASGVGAATGGVVDAAGALAKFGGMALDRYKNTVTTRDALNSFTKALGAGRGDDVIPTYQEVGKKVSSKLKDLEATFKSSYDDIENAAGITPVRLLPAAKAGGEFTLSDDVAKILTPRSRAVLTRISDKGSRASDILDESGSPIQVDEFTTFADVRNTIREIRAAARNFDKGDVSRLQLKRAEGMLNDDLLVWAMRNDKNRAAYEAAKEVDSQYRQQVVPFYSKKTPIGRYRNSEVMDEKALNNAFMTDESGIAIRDLKQRVPEATDDLRKLYANKLRESRGDILTIRKLESGTTGEALLSKKEREYLGKVASEIYKEGGPAQNSSVMPTGVLRLAEKASFSDDLQRMTGGLRPYGAQEYTGSQKMDPLIRYLRSIGVHSAVGE